MEGSGYFMLSGGYKQSGGGQGTDGGRYLEWVSGILTPLVNPQLVGQ